MLTKHLPRLVSRWYEKKGLNEYVYDFSVDYDAIAVDDILHILYLYSWWHSKVFNEKKKNDIKMLRFIKKGYFRGLTMLSVLTGVNILTAGPLSCISMTNKECKVTP